MLQQHRNIFVSRQASKTYCEYALSQIKKARGCNKRVHNPQPIEAPSAEGFCRFIPPNQAAYRTGWQRRPPSCCHVAALENSEAFRLYDYGADAKGIPQCMLVCRVFPADEKSRFIGFLLFNKNAFEKAKRNIVILGMARQALCQLARRVRRIGLRCKNLMHTFRLLYSSCIMRHGEPLVRFRRKASRVDGYPNGRYSYDELLKKVSCGGRIGTAPLSSSCRKTPDVAAVDRLLLAITDQWEKDHAR